MGAGDLKVGDKIRQADGTTGTVRMVKTEQKSQTMYNLEVASLDNFYVGEQGWLVHNASPCPNLLLHEKLGGHLISKHVGMSEAYLRNRMSTFISNGWTTQAATTLNDYTTAQKVVGSVLSDTTNIGEITNWLSSPSNANLVLYYSGSASDIIGFGVDRAGSVFQSTAAEIILKKDGLGGWFVLTGYPVKYGKL